MPAQTKIERQLEFKEYYQRALAQLPEKERAEIWRNAVAIKSVIKGIGTEGALELLAKLGIWTALQTEETFERIKNFCSDD